MSSRTGISKKFLTIRFLLPHTPHRYLQLVCFPMGVPTPFCLPLVYSVPGSSNISDAPAVAPGAENVGHAQILSEYSKPFELEGFFGAADAGAFGTSTGARDVAMKDEEGDIFWDAVEAMDEDGYGTELSCCPFNFSPLEQDANEYR